MGGKDLSQATKLGGHRLCSAKAVCFPDFQPENIKKTKTPIWENNSPFQTDKTPFYFAETLFFSRLFQAKISTKSRLHPPRFNYRQNKNLHFLKRNLVKSKIIHTFAASKVSKKKHDEKN